MNVKRFFGFLMAVVGGCSTFLLGPCVWFAAVTGGPTDHKYTMLGPILVVAGIVFMKFGKRMATPTDWEANVHSPSADANTPGQGEMRAQGPWEMGPEHDKKKD